MTAGTPVRTEPAAGRGLHRQFGWLLASRLIGALLQVVTLGLLARLAGGGDFGRVSAFLGIALALSAAGDFGVGAYLTSVRAAHPDSSQIADALRLNAVSAWLVTALLGAGLTAAGVWGNGVYLAMVPLAAWTGCERLTEARLSIAIADGDTRENTMSVLVRRVTGLVIMLALLPAAGHREHGAVGVFALAQAMSAVAGWRWAEHRLGPRVRTPGTGRTVYVLRRSWPFWINTASAQLRNLDVSVVAALAGAQVAGIYAVPSRLTTPLRMVPTTLATVALPAASRGGQRGLRRLAKAFLLTTAVTTAGLLTAAAAAPWALALLGPEYEPALRPLQIVCVGLIFAGVASFLNSLLQGRAAARFVAVVSTVTGVLTLAAVGIGAVLAGATGAAWGVFATFVLQIAMLLPLAIDVVRHEMR